MSGLNSVLSVRNKIGAIKQPVSFITREWTGKTVGDGISKDTETEVYPAPHIVDYSHSIRLQEGGAIKQGDLLLKAISKSSFPSSKDIDGSSEAKNIERFFKVGEYYYTVISVRERYLTWDVQVRKHSVQE